MNIAFGGAMLISAGIAFAQQSNTAPFDYMRCLDTYEADQAKFFAKTKAQVDQGKLTAPLKDAKDKEIRELYSKQFFPGIGKQGNDAANKKWCDDRVMDLRGRNAALDAPTPVPALPPQQTAKPAAPVAPPPKTATPVQDQAMAAQAAKNKQCQDQLDSLEGQIVSYLKAAKAAGKMPPAEEAEHSRSLGAIKASNEKMARGNIANVCTQAADAWNKKLTTVKRMYPGIVVNQSAASSPAPLSPADYSKCNVEGTNIFREGERQFNSRARAPKDKQEWENKKGAFLAAQSQFSGQKYQSICARFKSIATSAKDFAFSVR